MKAAIEQAKVLAQDSSAYEYDSVMDKHKVAVNKHEILAKQQPKESKYIDSIKKHHEIRTL